MIAPLYDYQSKIINENKLKCGIFTDTGSSKTRISLELAEGKILVICPKQQREDRLWFRENKKWDINKDITVISKEDLRRDWQDLPAYDTVIIDECENNFGVMPETRQRKGKQIPKTSQIFEATFLYLRKFPPKRLYLCSATPVGRPMQMWAIGVLLGEKWNFLKFREVYYFPIRIGQRQVWLPRKDEATQQRLANLVKKFGYTGALSNFFKIPQQTHEEVFIELTEPQKEAIINLNNTEADPMSRRARIRTIENGVLYGKKIEAINEREDQLVNKTTIYPSKKIDYILEKAKEYPKLLIFINYTAQIEETAKVLRAEGYHVFELTGATKDRSTMLQDAENAPTGIVIAQSSISSGYELPSFSTVIFASKSWQYRHYKQGVGRVLRSNALKENLYLHLIVKGGPDYDCHQAIMSGQDFFEKVNYQE